MAAYYMIRYKYLPVIRRQRSTMAAYYMIRSELGMRQFFRFATTTMRQRDNVI